MSRAKVQRSAFVPVREQTNRFEVTSANGVYVGVIEKQEDIWRFIPDVSECEEGRGFGPITLSEITARLLLLNDQTLEEVV